MTDLMSKYFLFANPSFLSEMGRIMDLGSTLNEYNSSPYEGMADYFAIKSDWHAVGTDIGSAIAEHGKER
jgi:hypothetical protein